MFQFLFSTEEKENEKRISHDKSESLPIQIVKLIECLEFFARKTRIRLSSYTNV